jgi:hypothetical protein
MQSSDSDHDNSSEDEGNSVHLFKSSLDVGSHFVDMVPETELVFVNHEGSLVTQLTL